ncbi:MAG: hypothetical protein A2015_04925 [Spirochaetes bacterium GWF1_31_7]|nr:MAG: hypothetical protein A2Y30_05295 [Spirochaetes bacterium GWE1_32_154]OHD48808.1 MAG: hypothetical protein A2Y29_03275 [Spirochaetes bacterium GWE2_31_10]OHD52870.1 MAG: hypothetical protein A2015_04925 [Spirochaetes bacterium GWF1_31_7]HBD94677.1 hypothetical protein [Spirochaetia bacterium]HBI37512.1 hypothetical protein [Spirochaetia bacterium]
MIKNVINNVFILKDGLEPNLEAIQFNEPLIQFIPISLDDIKTINTTNLDKIKEHNLFIVRIDQLDEDKKKKFMNFFINSFNFSFPYILFLTNSPLTIEEEENIIKMDSFYYILPEKIEKHYSSYFKLFVKAIFEKLHYIGRINSYIIDAFQTIVNAQIIEDQRNEILNLNQELTKLSKTDYLTNVLNRRAFFDALESERKRTLREHWRIHESNTTISESAEPLQKKLTILHKPHGCFFDHYGNYCCIILDIDHFKYINDTYGHLKGDEVLKELGKILNSKEIFRENDTIARYGGEEFVIMLPETNIFHAKIPAERLRKQIKNLDFTSDDGKTFRVTISIGISEFRISDTTNEDIINRADQALYFAKENGRDQVIVYEDIMND